MKPHDRKAPAGQGVWVREDRLPPPADLAWLTSAEGQAVCREMDQHAPADTPAHIARWREQLTPERVATAWGQVLLRRQGRAKFSRADDMLLDRVGLEQATDEIVAAYKAQRFAGVGHVADLCCGIGGDALALAACADVTAVDWSQLRTAMAEHNARVYERSIKTQIGDVAVCRPQADAVHIDPDRRPKGARRHAPEAGSPDLQTLQQIVGHYVHAAIKLSPGADFKTIGLDAEIEVISHKGQCKQAVAWIGRFNHARRRATALPTGESISADEADGLAWPASRPITSDKWLYEPDSAVVRADLVGVLARKYDLAPVDPLIAYLVGDQQVDSALLTPFRVLEIADFSTASARQLLSRHDVGTLEIKSRGFAARPEELRKLLRPRGSRPATLFLTRLSDRARAILAERPGQSP